MEGQGFSFGQPVSIVCPVIRAPQRAVQEEQQRCAAPEPLVAPAYVPRRRQGSGAVGNAGRSSVLRTVAANQPTAADADNSRPVVRYVGRDGDTSPPGSAPRADDTPAETPAALDPLLLLCQAAQQQGYESLSETEENEQQVAVGPEVHAGEPSFADTSPESTDAGQYGESVDGHRELPVEEHHELSVQQQHELPVEEQHELPSQQHHELPVGEHHEPPVQESHELPASSTIPIAMRVNGLEVSCQFRQLDLTGTALLPADGVAGQGALTVAVAPVYEESGVPQPPTEKFIFLYPDPSSVFEAPVPQVAVPATGQSDSSALCQYSGGEAHQRSEWQLKAIEFNNPDSMMACYERDDKARPPDSGRDSPFLKCSVQHGKRALHLDCDLEKCCKSSDDHSYAAQTLSVGDSTAQLSEIVEASPSVALQELAPTECPQSAEGESQKPDEEADVTIATPDSTGETLTAGARAHLPEGPVREETVLCTSEVEPNSDTTESDVNSRATAAPDAVVTTVTSQDGTAGENSKTPDDRLDDSAPNDCHTNGEVRNAATAPLGRRRKNPVRRHILPATPPAGRKPVGRKRAAAAPPDAAVVRRGRKKRAAQPDPPEEPEKQHARANAYTAQELILPEQVAKAASERPNGVSNTGSTLRRGGGRRRRGAEPGRRRRPAAALADSTVDEEVATVARDTHRKKGLRDTAARRAAKASRRCCVQWTLQPLSGQDPPLRLIVKRTLTVSESSDLAAEYAANEDITSPKPGPRGRRHSTNDCQSNRRESQMDNSLRFSQNVDQPDSSVQWRKRRNPVSLSSVDGEEDVSNDADDDEEDEDDDDDYDDEDWVPKSYKYRKSVAGAHSNLSKRVHLAKRRKSINVGADDYLKISCVKTVETVTASPEQVAETNKEESLITSTDTMHLPEREKTAVVETTVTAIVDTPKSSVEEHVPDTTEVTVTSHSTTECSQPLVSQIQHKVSCDTYETCQEPAPKKYKKAWQELWSAQQNNVSSLPEVACRSKELQHGEERCTRDLTQPPTAETQVVASPSSSSHVDQQDTSEGQCKGKVGITSKISSQLTVAPHSLSDDSVETLSDTTTDESDSEANPVIMHQKFSSVVQHQDVAVHSSQQPQGFTMQQQQQQQQGLIAEAWYMVNRRMMRVQVQGHLDGALNKVPQEIIEHCVQQLKRSNESVHSLHYSLFPSNYLPVHNQEVKPFLCRHIGRGVECPFYPPCTRVKQEPVDDIQLYHQHPILTPSSGMFPYDGQPLGCANVVVQTEGCFKKDCYRRKEVAADSEKHGSDNKTIVIQISDSDDDCSGNNSAKSGKIQGGDETKNERGQRSHRTFRTERRRKKKVIIFKKINGEYRTTERSVNVVQQESSSLSKVVEESPPHGRSSQLPSTEELARDISSHSQKHIEQVTQCEHDIQVPESFYHSSSINLQSNFIPLNDSNRPLLDKEDPNKSSTCLPDSAEESNNSKANDALKMKGSAQQFQEMTEEKTQDIHLSNSQHEKLQHDITKRKLASAEEITESENQISISAVPRPDMHLSVNKDQSASPQLNSSLPVPGNNCLREATTPKSDGETENVSLDHSKLVTGNDRKHSEKRDEPKLAHLTVDTDCRVQKSCEASNNIDKKQTDGIHGGALNKLCQETCESSGDMVMRQDTNIHQADMNDVTQEPCEISRNVVKKVADDTHEIDLNNVALKTFEASDNILLKQVDKAQGADLNDVGVKERLFAAQISTKHDSKSRGDVRQSKEESKLELHCDENQQQHFNTDKQHSLNETNEMSQSNNKQNTEDTKMENSTDNMTNPEDLIDEMEVTGKLKKPDETTNELEGIAVAREETQDNSNKETLSPGAVCVTSNCEYVTTDTNLRERINLKDTSSPSHVVTTVAADSETPQPGAEVSSGNLIDQLLQSQQNSKVFDPLVSLIKTRPIVGDSALRYEMMVKKELARIYQKEAKQKKKKSKKQISSAGKSETKKTKKKPKGFCSFRGNDKGMDGCGPGKGGFGGDTFTFTAIVRSYGGDCISNLYRSLSTKGVNIHKKCKALMKQSTDFSNSLDITCWLLYFGFQHVCLFSI
ncbi:uncharacterized protein LOC126278050 isoform X2 [Schistocerca gregaria]|uniref:uncharacterized protein LOC126278050 isoform X2 n=1 Tax=Schistocerca gregaria TaxID=7010 RepID=UPI00211EF9F6|nr:uncharacterized protein LOC126278050 isoform X2 [Schistocerca gregaria]XP_049833808.1 uncharacterized protein LOC126278050 isoform X2 [Schistocerca gregaria]